MSTTLGEHLLPQFIELADFYTSEDATGADLCQIEEDIHNLTHLLMSASNWPPDIKVFVDKLLLLIANVLLCSLNQGEAILSAQHLRKEVRRLMVPFAIDP